MLQLEVLRTKSCHILLGNFLLCALLSNCCFGQSKVLESQSLTSEILKREVKYSIYLPDGYESSTRLYPVVYLLHGYTYDETSWIQHGKVQEIVDQTIREADLSKMIIVMPDGATTWYQNDLNNEDLYEDFFVKELIQYIESQYKVRPGKQFRAVAGFSMGGWGALLLAMKHPDLFSSTGVINAAIYTDEQIASDNLDQQRYDQVFGNLYGKGLKGYERINEYYKDNAPLHLLNDLDTAELRKVRYYLDCGDDDFLIPGNMRFHELMRRKEIDHEFRVRDGSHTWQYWRDALPQVLKFIEQDFIKI